MVPEPKNYQKYLRNAFLWAVLFVVMFFGFQFLKNSLIQVDSGNKQTQDVNPDVTSPDQYFLGQILDSQNIEHISGQVKVISQLIHVKLLSGSEKGTTEYITQESNTADVQSSSVQTNVVKGELVVVAKIKQAQGDAMYFVADKYRFPAVGIIVIGFFLLAMFFGRRKGFTSILGLIISIIVLAKYLIPYIISGGNPLIGSLISALVIAVVSLYLAHGFNKRTSIALFGTLITLTLAAVLATVSISFAKLFGLGSEDAVFLNQLGTFANLDFRGLLLGGIMIGALGVLDDTTTIQSATIEELKKADSTLSFSELYQRGLSVGREHITSLVNTLFLAYAGSQIPLFLLFYAYPNQPLWVTLNSEFVAEEMVRTLVGSAALVLAVPITTLLAAYFYSKKKNSKPEVTADT